MSDDQDAFLAEDTDSERRARLKADVALMRELGVSQWGNIVLGNPPPPATEPRTESTQPRLSPEEQAKRDEEHRRRLCLASSGGPVLKRGAI